MLKFEMAHVSYIGYSVASKVTYQLEVSFADTSLVK